MKNNQTKINNTKISKQNAKIQAKQEKQKALNNIIESHTLKYYGYFNIIFQFLIFIILILSFVSSCICLYQNKKLYNYIDTTTKLTETSAKDIPNIDSYAITDLTDTSWEFNNYFYFTPPSTKYFLNFESNSASYSQFLCTSSGDEITIEYRFPSNIVFDGSWSNQAYRLISITGGAAATNSSFISWLQSNATLQNSSPTPTQLTTPTLSSYIASAGSLQGATFITWDSDSNASQYAIYKDNTLIDTINAFEDNLPNNEYRITSTGTYQVKSIGDGTNYSDSNLSNSVSISSTLLTAPTVSLSDITLSWSSITNATKYEIYKDNTLLTTISNTSYTINSVGTYQVKAINDGYSSFRYLSSNLSNSVTFTATQFSTPTLDGGFSYNGYTLSWSFIQYPGSQVFEIYKDNVLLDTINTYHYFLATQNGTYQVKQISTDFRYSDSNLSNSVTISNLYHVDFTLPNNTTSRTYYAQHESTTTDDFYFVFDNFTDTYPYTIFTIDNTNQSNSYVFRENTTITLDNGSATFDYEYIDLFNVKIHFTAVSSDISLSITNYDTIPLNGSYAFIGSQNYNANNLPTDITFTFNFKSNDINFSSIVVDTSNQCINYTLTTPVVVNDVVVTYYTIFKYSYDIPNNYFIFNYLTQSTGNYLFIEVENQYLDVDLYFNHFTTYYRQATLQDYENLGYQNGVIDSNQYTMANLIFALFDTPILALRSLLNFNFFGVNLFALFTLILTMLVLFVVAKFFKGGKDNDKK